MYQKPTLIKLAMLLGLASNANVTGALVLGTGPGPDHARLNVTRPTAAGSSSVPLPPPVPVPTRSGSPPGLAQKRRTSSDHALSGRPEDLKKNKNKRAAFDASRATLNEYASHALEVAKARMANSTTCTAENLTVRKLWDNMSVTERINYTDALNCLMDKPTKTPTDLAPGAKTRYDDWVVTHINQTLHIHSTANFLGWHRWFTWSMEQALRDECGYTGTVPYWDWVKTEQEGFSNSQLFDGSATSLSGNGSPLNYTDADWIVVNVNTTGELILPHGTGGGCVTSGPFVNMTVNLGPDGLLVMDSTTSDNSSYLFEYNPRCLKRDLTDAILHRWANTTSVLDLLRQDNIWAFETTLQGPEGEPELGVHGAGHYSTGGDPGRDFYVSPGDPIFWSHHANIDRVWWMWQMLDPDVRASTAINDLVSTGTIDGPLTINDEYEPHGNGTAASLQNLGYVAEGQEFELGSLMSTTEGMFCYVYE